MKNHPQIYKDINISRLFNKYQIAVCNVIQKHESLPIESYVHELTSLTQIFFLCKNQHSEIAEKIFSLDLLKDLTRLPELETMNDSPDFPMEHFMTITKTITNLTLNKRTSDSIFFFFSGFSVELWPKATSFRCYQFASRNTKIKKGL